ncbi:SMI1/KNR4 family protein [Embleya sp. NPDC005971]|uniref:SMI1/KNR4 family protein n=1 Tax=Embleya sp. NPDC005971 TaxID=3156724 RepID=UPI0033EEAB10
MTDTAFDWRCFLERWSEEWADTCRPEDVLGAGEEAARRTRRLGFEPASPARIQAMEERLGMRMPPSYREFLAVTDGQRNAGASCPYSVAPRGPDGSWTTSGSPRTRWEAERAAWTGTSSSYDDKAPVAIGRAGPDWAFAFDARPQPFHEGRFVSPVGAASQAGRAVVVWCAPDRPGSPGGLFHLSVAEGGAECHAFTVQGATVRRSGDIPPALDPDRLFPPRAGELFSASGHRRALAAVTAEFGVALPRFALTRGRLHTLTTASWTRPPGSGEGYLTTAVTLR